MADMYLVYSYAYDAVPLTSSKSVYVSIPDSSKMVYFAYTPSAGMAFTLSISNYMYVYIKQVNSYK